MSDATEKQGYVLLVYSSHEWDEKLVPLIEKSCAEPIRREDLRVWGGAHAGEGGPGGASFDLKDAVILGIWVFGGIAWLSRTPQALQIIGDALKHIDAGQVAIVWTNRPELAEHMIRFGQRCACVVKELIVPSTGAATMNTKQAAHADRISVTAGLPTPAGASDLLAPDVRKSQEEVSQLMRSRAEARKASDPKKAAESLRAIREAEERALGRLKARKQLIVT